MEVTLLGLGLIGGSVARDLAAARVDDRSIRVRAWSPSGRGPRAALAEGVIDDAPERAEDAVAGAELVVLAAPPLEVLATIERLAAEDDLGAALAPDSTVTDVASTKVRIVERARAAGLRFVGGHPMAGLEASGWGAAVPGLFRDRPWVVAAAPDAGGRDVDRVEWLVRTCGARPVRLSPAAHDRAVAAISHLPLLVSAAVAESMTGPGSDAGDAARLAAGGWSSLTRLAAGDPAMGAGILTTNAGPVADDLRALLRVLEDWLAELERASGPDADRVAARLAATREQLRAFDAGGDH